MARQDVGYDRWLVMLVVAIFVVGVSIYIGWEDVGSLARKVRLSLFGLF